MTIVKKNYKYSKTNLKEINWSFYTVEEQCEIANNFKSNKENGITYENTSNDHATLEKTHSLFKPIHISSKLSFFCRTLRI